MTRGSCGGSHWPVSGPVSPIVRLGDVVVMLAERRQGFLGQVGYSRFVLVLVVRLFDPFGDLQDGLGFVMGIWGTE